MSKGVKNYNILGNNKYIYTKMVRYKCECNYETHDITKMKRHLARVVKCIPGKDMSNVDTKTLIIEPMLKTPTDLTDFTIEERRIRRLKQKIDISNKFRAVRILNGGFLRKKITIKPHLLRAG
jgi:hypothetical protein